MNCSIFWRVFWKEYRLQRALWLAMAALTTVVLLLVAAFTIHPPDRLSGVFLAALALPAFYALGCGATLFAGEHEAGTYEFQRALPLVARQAFFAKIAFALTSATAMVGLMLLLVLLLGGERMLIDFPTATCAVVGLFGLEMFLWATLFSLLLKRVLIAAILGVSAASATSGAIAMLIASHGGIEAHSQVIPCARPLLLSLL